MLIISILVFCIVLFLYLHVYFHLKHSNDLEVYEIEQPSKQRLEEVCDIRQPTTFYYSNEQLLYLASYNSIYTNYRAFDIQLRDASNSATYLNDSQITTDANELYIPIALKVANQAFRTDKDAKFLSENNSEFIEETGLIKLFQLNDEFLRPYMVSNCYYDILIASLNTHTPLRYEVNYRNYFMVTQGRAKILLIPPKYTKYLFPIDDYENFEFISPVNPWNVQSDYQNEFDKLKTLDVELTSGMMMYIPAYWWYSIKFLEHDTSVCSFKYRTYMSNISILPRLCMKVLQNHNVKRDTIKKRTFIPVPGETVFSSDASSNSLMNAQQMQSNMTMNASFSNTGMSNTSMNYNSVDGTTLITDNNNGIPTYGDQLLPSSMRNSGNPFAMMNTEENKERLHGDVPIISAALSSNVINGGNVSSLSNDNNDIIMPSGTSTNTEVILTNDNMEHLK
jgi:hypothetical protein